MRKRKPHRKTLDLLNQIVDTETQSSRPISINKLHKVSSRYTPSGRKISRDTISTSLPHLKDVVVQREPDIRGRRGAQIISKRNLQSTMTWQSFVDFFEKRDLNTKLKVVEGFNQLVDQRFKELDEMFEREDTPDKIITRYRKTGETAFIVNLGFPEDQKKKRKHVHS